MEQLKTKYIILISLFISSIINLINCIICSYPLFNYFIYPGILLCLFIFYLIFKDYQVNTIFFIICSILSIIFGDHGNLTGSVFLCFAFYLSNNKKILIIAICIMIISMLIKFILNNSTLPQIINYIIVFISIILIYFDLIHPRQIKDSIIIKIDTIDSEILNLLVLGLKNKEVADRICLSSNTVTKRIEKLRDKFNCYNNEQLIYKMFKNNFF